MTSLTEVYDGSVGGVAGRRRKQFGLALFLVGAGLVVGGIVVATTGVAARFGLGTYEARELAGVLAGLGVPAALLGSFTLLPASRRTRAAAVIGTGLTVFGVTLFREAYPTQWIGAGGTTTLTLPVIVVYGLGVLTTFWCLFLAVANFKTRNDPGGTVRMKVTEAGTTRVLEVSGSVPGFGSVGLFGNLGTDTGTATTLDDTDGDEGEVIYARDENPTPARERRTEAASDGGSAAQTPDDGGSPGDEPPEEVREAATTRGQPDPYCGNCEQFQYVRVDGELEPYCGLDSTVMDDMDPCEDWQPNR